MSIKTAVIGHPISHSKSPLIHNFWIKQHGLTGTYDAVDIPCEELEAGIKSIINQGYIGFNVTLPHKVSIMDLCDEVDDLARSIGAVNTVTIKDGQLLGTNTDAFGFIENIKQNAPTFDFTKGKAVVLGAGGAANAIIYALLQEGVTEIVISNRTRAKAEKLQELDPQKIKIADWEARHDTLVHANIIINTTALGMISSPPLEIDLDLAPSDALVTDIVYAPLMTDLLQQAQDQGLKTVTGIGMLLHQARPGFELWHGVLPDVTEELERIVLA